MLNKKYYQETVSIINFNYFQHKIKMKSVIPLQKLYSPANSIYKRMQVALRIRPFLTNEIPKETIIIYDVFLLILTQMYKI